MTSTGYVDLSALTSRLRAELRGSVSDDAAARALYTVDASNHRVVPDLVVVPRDTDDLSTAVTLTSEAGAPVTLRSGGTSMAGNVLGGVVIDVSRHLTSILDLDPVARTAMVEPGVVLSDLLAAAGPHGLTFGADPSSATRATLGGMIANNACGAHSVAWGTTADNLRGLDVLLSDGTTMTLDVPEVGADPADRRRRLETQPGRAGNVARTLLAMADSEALLIRRRFGGFSRQISGYALQHLLPEHGHDLTRLLCGSEGTLATTLRATVALTPLPAARALLALGFADSVAAADSVPVLLPHGPLTVESINAALVGRLPDQVRREAQRAGLPDGEAWLLIEMAGESAEAAQRRAAAVVRDLAESGIAATSSVIVEPRTQAVLWRCRRDAAGLATRRPDGAEAWGGWEDAAVPPAKLGAYLSGLDELLARYRLSGGSYGHFGEGCMHMRMAFDLFSTEGVATYRAFVEEACDLVVSLGGSASGEHGDGRARSALLERMYGADAVALFDRVKQAWDPSGVMNPHVIVDPVSLGTSLRHTGAARGRELLTLFSYKEDAGSFAQAQRRCVGVGKCRQSAGGVMCPSYQVTREEQHSTRGRAHLLWEMLEGDVITDGWRSEEVKDALDLCLSCKGCLSDCPVNVDMATYKAEFTYHHYLGRPWARPRSHWSMGWLPLWARLAAKAPRLSNRLMASRAAGILKRLGGVAPERSLPSFAEQPFTRWFGDRPARAQSPALRGRALLWPDTFTNYLAPEVGRSAVEVLEAAGFDVVVPDRPLCCGLTWASTGQLDKAVRELRRCLDVLAPYVDADIPLVGLEPSCTAMFRHDALGLLGSDPRAGAVAAGTFTLAETLARYAPDWTPAPVGGEALVQVHCHQHAVMGFAADSALMAAAGLSATVPDSGCCGLAGNFGFEQGHYELSQAAGERVLLPAVREAAAETIVIADGFSCRTQIGQATSRRARHLAEVLAEGLDKSSPRHP
ncbi:MAG: FAD-binding and (Fe-S)-binding domain-containing protein [Nocardioidaceae bacterium]